MPAGPDAPPCDACADPRDSREREAAVALMAGRDAAGLDLWTGRPLGAGLRAAVRESDRVAAAVRRGQSRRGRHPPGRFPALPPLEHRR
jgi:hypothetical protein